MIGPLGALVQLHPLREGLWHTLITALYRNGRQADALAAYARVRDILAEELGLDPGRELQALEASVLHQTSWSEAARLVASPPATRPGSPHRSSAVPGILGTRAADRTKRPGDTDRQRGWARRGWR